MSPFFGECHIIRGRCKSPPISVERGAGRNQGEKDKSPEHEGCSKDSRKAKSKDHAVFSPGNAASSVTITNPRPAVRSLKPLATEVEGHVTDTQR